MAAGVLTLSLICLERAVRERRDLGAFLAPGRTTPASEEAIFSQISG